MSRKSARSKVQIFRKNFITHARDVSGAYATTADRMRIAKYFLNYLRDSGIKLRHSDSIKTRHFSGYLLSRKEKGICDRTVRNERAALRGVFGSLGKQSLADPDNPLLSNKTLGLESTSRDGTKLPLLPDEFRTALNEIEKKDAGVAATMQLAYVLGLRTKEAVESCKSIPTWKRALESGQDSVRVVFGTKGGRPRDTVILDRAALKHAIHCAEKVMDKNNGRLIDRPNIRQAIDRYRYHVRRAGLVGEKAPHSMRYHFSQEAKRFYEKNGFSEKEIYAQVSMDLGHGDGRGRYVKQVYFKGFEEES
ncbi:integrase domain-containing protein [Enterobacteriaceae bacterium H11S18]|uniref:integrase domain-containing protein n=1 Tax=Dryocola clanedunensis TaxID=2925396 RepID=UPI0022F08736|nr:integrase domain-containing protein [Dryocola clanedunensis]MCT4711358.1 integrase domain-containing protein [Dryocola clanedunensis]